MKRALASTLLGLLGLFAFAATPEETLPLAGLSKSVEIVRDPWGIAHIYAQDQRDLFFAQGFNAARDRLFQFEMWRRRATGTLSEMLGRRALESDLASRLLRLRVDMASEMKHYHTQGDEIIQSFVSGVNAYIGLTDKNPSLLPIEFKLLGIKPGLWTPEVVVSRHNGLYRNVDLEVDLARLIGILGEEKLRDSLYLHPGKPDLTVPAGLDLSLMPERVLQRYRPSLRFVPEDIIDPGRRARATDDRAAGVVPSVPGTWIDEGSNNWVIAGSRTLSGRPILANDPHRAIQVPSLRYWVHLVAPGWNVIGGGEPTIPGVSIGHNETGAWGITIFPIDQEDLYVYETQREDRSRYRYRDGWHEMKIIEEEIKVKGEKPVHVELKYTRHGPVLYEDSSNHRAYALRAAWLETGAAPYLASLRIDQARTWQEFRAACSYFRAPSLNIVWADLSGNTGWQVVGIAPVRRNWSGLLPVPGDGRFEWEGFLHADELPHKANPPEGFFATANQDNIPAGYPHALGYVWADPFRFARIHEMLSSGRLFSLTDMMSLQQDVLSLPARSLVPLLRGLQARAPASQRALELLLAWDYRLEPDSVEGAIYVSFERALRENVWKLVLPEEARRITAGRSMKKLIDWLTAPDGRFGADPAKGRDKLLIDSLEQGVRGLTERLGADMSRWKYGQERMHHSLIRHSLSDVVDRQTRSLLDVGPLPRGGNSQTVNNTSDGDNQASGASFRIIADLENWDNSVGTNSPGQSGDPASPHYRDLFEPWAGGKYFPVYYSREKVRSAAGKITILKPAP